MNLVENIIREVKRIPVKMDNKYTFSTVSEIVERNYHTGCSDFAHLFASIAREKGIPTVLIHAIYTEHFTKELNGISGHWFAEIYVDDIWYLVDPTTGAIYFNYDKDNFYYYGIGGREYYLMAKTLDKVESNMETLPRLSLIVKGIIRDVEWTGFQKPNYQIKIVR